MGRKINGVSVILCCYNSSTRLPTTLSYLAAQKVNCDIDWELIVVNNNSNDDTVDKAEKLWKQLNTPANLIIVDEPKPGLSYAREKGISVSQYDLLLFCDDDNWLQNDYLQNAVIIFRAYSEIGVLGGWGEAVFETEKPEWFDVFSGNFAVGKPQPESGLINSVQGFLYGAGMIIHKNTFSLLKNRGFKSILSDRKGKKLSSGGDVELIYAIKLLGVPVMFSELLFFYHYMPKERLVKEYFMALRRSMYRSNFVLNIYIDTLNNKPLSMLWILKKMLKSIAYIYIHSKKVPKLNFHKSLRLKNQIAIRYLFLKNFVFYYRTRKNLKILRDG